MRMNAVLPDPNDPRYEKARELMVGELENIGRPDPDNGFLRMAERLAEGQLAQVPTWIALGLLAKHLKG